MKSLAQNSLYNIIYQVLNLLFPLVTSVYVSRIIMEDGIGRVAYAQNVASYFVTIATLGGPAYGIREIAKLREKYHDKNRIFSELFIINAVSTVISTVLYLVLVFSIASYRNNLALYLCTGLLIFLNIINIDWLYQGEEEYGYITFRSFVIKVMSLIALFVLVRNRNDYLYYAMITSLGTACNYIFNVIHARKYVKFTFKNLNLACHIRPLLALAAAGFLGNIYSKIDVTMLGYMSTNSIVGYYSNAHKIVLILLTGCQAVSAAFMPRLSYYYKSDKKALEDLVQFGCKLLMFIAIPAFVGLLVLAPSAIVLLYGDNFASAGITLQIFAPLLIIRPLGDLLCYQLLISIGKENKRVSAYVIAAIVNVVLNCLLIPVWQQNGAAIASVVSEVLVNVIQLVEVKKMVEIHFDKKLLGKSVFAACVMGGGILFSLSVCGEALFTVACIILFGIMIYFLINWFLGNEILMMIVAKSKKEIRKVIFR